MKPSMWIAISMVFGIAACGSAVWGWRANQSTEKMARAMTNASARANAERASLEGRLAEAEAKAKTLQSIIDQTAGHQTAQAQAAQAERDAQIQAMQAEVEAARRQASAVAAAPQPFYSAPANPAPAAPEARLAIKVVAGDVKFVSSNTSYVTWSWKAKVLNPSSVPLSGYIKCELMDRGGFRLVDDLEKIESLGPGRTFELTGEGIAEIPVWERYKRHRFLVE